MIFFCQVKAESDVINGSWKPGGDSTGLADSIGEFNKDVNKERGGSTTQEGGSTTQVGGSTTYEKGEVGRRVEIMRGGKKSRKKERWKEGQK